MKKELKEKIEVLDNLLDHANEIKYLGVYNNQKVKEIILEAAELAETAYEFAELSFLALKLTEDHELGRKLTQDAEELATHHYDFETLSIIATKLLGDSCWGAELYRHSERAPQTPTVSCEIRVLLSNGVNVNQEFEFYKPEIEFTSTGSSDDEDRLMMEVMKELNKLVDQHFHGFPRWNVSRLSMGDFTVDDFSHTVTQ